MTTKEAITLFGGAATELVCALSKPENNTTQLQRYIDAYDMAISALRAQQEKPFGGWISVKDKLPEVGDWNKNVLTISDVGQFRVAYYDGHCWRNSIGEIVGWLAPITHWMPLPEPPQEV